MKVLLKILPLLPFLFVFISSLYTPSDPDLGWHLKYGEYFFQHGTVLRENIFSVLMPDYRWANTSWLTDVLTYTAYSMGGFLGLSILGALVVTITFYFFSKAARLTLWDQTLLFPFLLYLEQLVNAVSFRGQQLSLMLLGVLFYLLSRYGKRPRILLWCIPLFLLWSNLHGEFLLGLVLFAVWIGLYILRKISRNDVKELGFLAGIFIASVCATIINPFGIGIHTAALSHVGSPLLKNITEYLPFEMLTQPWWNQVIVGILLCLSFIYLFLRGKVAKSIPILGSGLLIFILSFEVRRYAWPAYYLILPLLAPIAHYFRPDSKKVTRVLTIIFLGCLLTMAIWSKQPLHQFHTYNWTSYCQNPYVKCSPEAAEYLIKNDLSKDLYSLYSWGGWLIWQYPEVKPTIDGRMHLWEENGYSGFEDYYAIEQNFKDIDKTNYKVALVPIGKPVYNRLIKLENQGKWKTVFEDEHATIFKRK